VDRHMKRYRCSGSEREWRLRQILDLAIDHLTDDQAMDDLKRACKLVIAIRLNIESHEGVAPQRFSIARIGAYIDVDVRVGRRSGRSQINGRMGINPDRWARGLQHVDITRRGESGRGRHRRKRAYSNLEGCRERRRHYGIEVLRVRKR